MNRYDWPFRFRRLYDKAIEEWEKGNRDRAAYFSDDDRGFLQSIGAQSNEMVDYAEDANDLPFEMALLITAVRRDYFLLVQGGELSSGHLSVSEFPPKSAELEGIRWLPRLMLKAKARLRGELPDELMYCCGGDRAFFKRYNIHPAEFLRLTWAADRDESVILDYVKARRS